MWFEYGRVASYLKPVLFRTCVCSRLSCYFILPLKLFNATFTDWYSLKRVYKYGVFCLEYYLITPTLGFYFYNNNMLHILKCFRFLLNSKNSLHHCIKVWYILINIYTQSGHPRLVWCRDETFFFALSFFFSLSLQPSISLITLWKPAHWSYILLKRCTLPYFKMWQTPQN